MRKFISSNFTILRKFWVYQFAISLLGVMVNQPVFSFVGEESTSILPILSSIFTGGFFCFLIYSILYEKGAKDGVKTETGSRELKRINGLYLCLIAYMPSLLIIAAEIILYFTANTSLAFKSLSMIINFVIHAMYSGFAFYFNNGIPSIIVLLISPLLAILTGAIGYMFGFSGKSLRERLGFKDDSNKLE